MFYRTQIAIGLTTLPTICHMIEVAVECGSFNDAIEIFDGKLHLYFEFRDDAEKFLTEVPLHHTAKKLAIELCSDASIDAKLD